MRAPLVRFRATQSCLFNARCRCLSVTTDSLTARAHIHPHALHRDNDKHEILKTGLRAWVAQCVCLVSHCSACECVWRPFSTTQGAVLTLHMTQDRFMALLRTTQLATAYVYTLQCVSCIIHPPWVCVLYACIYVCGCIYCGLPRVFVCLCTTVCVRKDHMGHRMSWQTRASADLRMCKAVFCATGKDGWRTRKRNKDRQWSRHVCCQTGPHCTTHAHMDLNKSTCCSYKLDSELRSL